LTLMVKWEGRAIAANRRLAQGKGRFYSEPRYQNFINSMAWLLKKKARGQVLKGDVAVRLELVIPKQMDTDSLIKPCMDALQRSGVIVNDNQVRMVTGERIGVANGESRITFFVRQETGMVPDA